MKTFHGYHFVPDQGGGQCGETCTVRRKNENIIYVFVAFYDI